MTRVGLFCERLIEAGWLVALAIVPLYFNLHSSRVFEPDKISMLRGLVAVLAFAQLVKWLESLRDPRGSAGQSGAGSDDVPRGPLTSLRSWWRGLSDHNPLALPTVLLVASYLLATAFSISPLVSLWGSYQRLQGTYTMLSCIVLFFLVAANLRRREQIERIFNVILLVSVPISLYGIAQHNHRDPLPWAGDVTLRVTSTMGNAIFLAAYLIMVIPITLQRFIGASARLYRLDVPDKEALRGLPQVLLRLVILLAGLTLLGVLAYVSAKNANLWWAALPVMVIYAALSPLFSLPRATFLTTLAEVAGYALLLVLQILTTVLTQSRGPWLGIMAGLLCFGIVLALRRRVRWLLGGLVGLTLCGVLFLVTFNLPNSPLEPLKSVPYVGRLGALLETEGGTGRVRVLIWQGTLDLLSSRPPIGVSDTEPLGPARLLFGYGPESMYVVYNKVYPADLAHYETRNATPDRNHNDTLDYLVQSGIFGLLAYIFLLVVAVRLLWHHLWRAQSLAGQLPVVAILAALVAHVVESQTGIVIAVTRTYFWVYLAIAVAAGLLYRSREQAAAGAAAAATGPAPVAAAVSPVSGTARLKRRQQRRGGSDNGLDGTRPSPGRQRLAELPLLAGTSAVAFGWLALATALLFLLLGLGAAAPIQDAVLPLLLGFAGLLLIAAFIAWGLGTWPSLPSPPRSRAWPLYVAGGLLAVVVICQNLFPIAADIYYKRGFASDQQRRYDLSLGDYNRALALASSQDYYYLFLGRAYLELARTSQRPNVSPPFEPTLSKLRTLGPNQLASLGREDLMNASRVVLEEALAIDPLNTDHYANLGRLYRIWGEMGDSSKFALADRFYREATIIRPQAAHLFYEWGLVDFDLGKTEDALAKAKKAIGIDPVYPLSFVLLGDAYQLLGQPGEALPAHNRALEIDPASLLDPRFDQRLSEYQKAELLGQVDGMFAQAVKRSADVAAVHSAYGYILSRENKAAEALAEFQAVVRLTPNDWVAHRNIALLYQSMGMFDQAITSAQTAQRLAPQDQNASLQNIITELQQRRQRP